MSDILDRLRTLNGGWHDDLATEAILEITRLREQVEQYRWRRVEDDGLPTYNDLPAVVVKKNGRGICAHHLDSDGDYATEYNDDWIEPEKVAFWIWTPPLPDQGEG